MSSMLRPDPATNPFRLRTPSDNIVEHPAWGWAHDAAIGALGTGRSVVVLGASGSGKSTLLRHLATDLKGQGRRIRMLRGEMPARGSGGDGDPDLITIVDDISEIALPVLVAALRGARPFLLAAAPAFEHHLAGLPQPVVAVRLEPMLPQEVAHVLAARLSDADLPRSAFEAEAVLAVARHAHGLFRRVLVLAGAAWLLAQQEGVARVAATHVEAAALQSQPAVPDGDPVVPDVAPARSAAASRAMGADERGATSRRRAAIAAVVVGAASLGTWAATMMPGPVRGPVPTPVQPQSPPPSAAPLPEAPKAAWSDPASAPFQAPESSPAPLREAARPAVSAPPVAARPSPGPQTLPPAVIAYRGPVLNLTLNRSGTLSLVIQHRPGVDAVTAEFQASAGLVGAGTLSGTVSADGRMALSGRLMMGRNPFDCTLVAQLQGRQLAGSATFVRVGRDSPPSRSTFTLEQM